jgi:copper chaperone
MTKVQEAVLSVPDVNCEHCVKTIGNTLGALPGVEAVSTNLSTKQVHVHYDPSRVTLNQVEATLDDVGYTVTH